MTDYTHIEMAGLFGSAAFVLPDGRQYPGAWWRTSSPQERSGLGFRIYEPEIIPPTLEERKAALYEAISAKRKDIETGGVEVGGAMIRTDATSQAKISGAIAFAAADPELVEIDWEAQPGVWITLDVATLTTIGIAVGRHVQACFSRARALSQTVTSASTHAALDAIDIEAGWAE